MQPKSWKLEGGLDLVTPALERHRRAGALIGCMNYESRLEGYRRIEGYERYDGRKSPSDDFDDDPGTTLDDIEARRALITEVPGEGDLLGVWRYADRTYAIRKDSGGEPRMYRSSPSGWGLINLGHACSFERGFGGSEPAPGEGLSAFGSSGSEVIGAYTSRGSWHDGTAEGFLVFDLSGSLSDWETGSIVTIGGDSSRTIQIKMSASKQRLAEGRWRFDSQNFYGQAELQRMYGVCESAGPGLKVIEFDGEALYAIETGVPADEMPIALDEHQNHLFIGYDGGSVVHSSLGDPRSWSALTGASEFAIGDEITGLLSGYHDLLVVWGRNKTAALFGATEQTWNLKTVSGEAGAIRDTGVLMDEPICLDDRGIRSLSATDKFGDLDIGVMSGRVRPLLDHIRDGGVKPVAAIRVRRKSQYRIFFDDGQCLVASYIYRGRYRSIEYTQTNYDLYNASFAPDYPVPGIVNNICSVEDSDGRERIFFSMEGSGYVYEMDRGTSFDGHRIQAYLRLPYNDFGKPDVIKRYRKAQVECNSTFTSKFLMSGDFSDDRVPGGQREEHRIVGPRSYWDEQGWSNFDWDGLPSRLAEQRISGRGRNLSLLFLSEQSTEPSHTFSGVTVLYDDRKMRR